MEIEDFNAMSKDEAVTAVQPCADIDSWVDAVVTGRPYADVDELLAAAISQAAGWTAAEVETALAAHPRIGERHPASGASADMSRTEQAGVDPADAELQQRIEEGNRRYEETFGRIYLVRAKGRSGTEMLDLLEQRLTNDPATELDVTKSQLAEIAALRLQALMS